MLFGRVVSCKGGWNGKIPEFVETANTGIPSDVGGEFDPVEEATTTPRELGEIEGRSR